MKVWITDPTDTEHLIQGEAHIETASLIAEIRNRKPKCEKCKHFGTTGPEECNENCIWMGVFVDNFKPAK